ncbi:MAG: lytic transglycosylase domain-containing protein [Chitinophagaceae bacterium]
MLKRKLLKTGLFTNGMMILVVVVTTAGTLVPSASVHQSPADTAMWVKFDPQLLQLSGLPETEIANAPAITLNKQAKKFVADYAVSNSEMLELVRQRGVNTFPIIDTVFSHYHLPLELKYLAVIESELSTKAVSKVGAAGTWQLMPVTARLLSLKVTAKYDERKHLYKSTVAAAKYLKDLYNEFGDWLLVIAAYNAGPGGVYKAIKKSGSRNFWKLQYFLPAETRDHVKKFIGTHYYFEGDGSVTTLTKAEVADYTKKMIDFVAKQNSKMEEKLLAKNTTNKNTNNPAGSDKIIESAVNTELRASEEE